jgi:hypothetical protein
MRLYHRTPAGDAILANGFRDATGHYMTGEFWTGVWVADRPLDENEGASGDDLLAVDIPEEIVVQWEWVQEVSFGYREFLIPADVLNAYPVARAAEEDQR